MAASPQINPDIILTHRRGDSHQDHRFVCELTWNTFRNNLILEYEIPKYDGDLSSPNLFVPISQELAERKIETILRCFETQRERHWFTEDVFMAMLRLRGHGGQLADAARGGIHLPQARARHGAHPHGALPRPGAGPAPTPLGRDAGAREPGTVRLAQIRLACRRAHTAGSQCLWGSLTIS